MHRVNEKPDDPVIELLIKDCDTAFTENKNYLADELSNMYLHWLAKSAGQTNYLSTQMQECCDIMVSNLKDCDTAFTENKNHLADKLSNMHLNWLTKSAGQTNYLSTQMQECCDIMVSNLSGFEWTQDKVDNNKTFDKLSHFYEQERQKTEKESQNFDNLLIFEVKLGGEELIEY
jgi:hypothetical protein